MGIYESFKDNTFGAIDAFEFESPFKTNALGMYLVGDDSTGDARPEKAGQTEDEGDAAYTPGLALQAFESGLESRDFDSADLSTSDWAVFKTAAAQISDILNSDVETTDDIVEMFGDDLNITVVDDFTSLDGTALNGAAIIGSNEIILNSNLEGEELRDVLVEELAETAYQQVFDDASSGDFGAETVAILSGEDNEAVAAYSDALATDTVETEAGTAEAAFFWDEAIEEILELREIELQKLVDFFAADLPDTVEIEATFVSADTIEQEENSYFYDDANNDIVYRTETFWGDTLESLFASNGETGDVMPWDLNLDGVYADTYDVDMDVGVDGPTGEIVGAATEEVAVPILGTTTTQVTISSAGPSDVEYSWSEDQEYSTWNETNWSDAVTETGTGSLDLGIFTAGLSGGGTQTTGGSMREIETLTSTQTGSFTQTVGTSYGAEVGDDYMVGWHTQEQDVYISSTYSLWIESGVEHGDLEARVRLDITDTRLVEDYLTGTTQTASLLDDDIAVIDTTATSLLYAEALGLDFI